MRNMHEFKPIHCQKDYSTGNIVFHYEGLFDKPKAVEFIKLYYSDFSGMEILEHEVPTYGKHENYGTVTFKK